MNVRIFFKMLLSLKSTLNQRCTWGYRNLFHKRFQGFTDFGCGVGGLDLLRGKDVLREEENYSSPARGAELKRHHIDPNEYYHYGYISKVSPLTLYAYYTNCKKNRLLQNIWFIIYYYFEFLCITMRKWSVFLIGRY